MTAKVFAGAMAVFAALLCVLLWPVWLHNPDVTHGLLMPVVFVFLLYHSRTAGTRRYLPAGAAATAAVAALSLAGIALLFVGGLYAAAIDWSNAAVQFLLAGALAFLLGAGLVALSSERIRWIPFNWASIAAAGLWILAAPIPPGTYTRLTIRLQLWISSGVVHTLHALGIVAMREGNVIRLASGAVGVEEACSGVRSLVSCVFVAIFLSAVLLRRPGARAAIIVLSVPIALGMNFLRSLLLTLLANAGVDIEGTWHDLTGVAILVVTSAILAGLALALASGKSKLEAPVGAPQDKVERLVPRRFSDGNSGSDASVSGRAAPPLFASIILGSALTLAAALVVFFYVDTHPAIDRAATAPDLWTILPKSQPGWTVADSNDLYQFSGLLRTEALAQRTYSTGGEQVTLYLAYWKPGQAPVSLVATHTPDACWPGSGWTQQPLPGTSDALEAGGRSLPGAESGLFVAPAAVQYVWFWHLYAGKPIQYISPYSIGRLLRIAWTYGFRHDGDQLFVRVSSNRPWADFSSEPFIQQFFARLQPLGL